jgi:hypothetical protein
MTNNTNINLDSKHVVQAVAVYAGAKLVPFFVALFVFPVFLLIGFNVLLRLDPTTNKMREFNEVVDQCVQDNYYKFGESRLTQCKRFANSRFRVYANL